MKFGNQKSHSLKNQQPLFFTVKLNTQKTETNYIHDHVYVTFTKVTASNTYQHPLQKKHRKARNCFLPHSMLKKACVQSKVSNQCICVGHMRSNSQDMVAAIANTYQGEGDVRNQVVVVGTPLPTASLPIGAQQGPVMVSISIF